ncbi:hypothetical protein B0H10DRAFT_1944934 [Mycena sp. CBHHK59/15]|nr:hypothetical protein B0H10DRAFT_1944934 [Mycena sp. CBHHK59/15]
MCAHATHVQAGLKRKCQRRAPASCWAEATRSANIVQNVGVDSTLEPEEKSATRLEFERDNYKLRGRASTDITCKSHHIILVIRKVFWISMDLACAQWVEISARSPSVGQICEEEERASTVDTSRSYVNRGYYLRRT